MPRQEKVAAHRWAPYWGPVTGTGGARGSPHATVPSGASGALVLVPGSGTQALRSGSDSGGLSSSQPDLYTPIPGSRVQVDSKAGVEGQHDNQGSSVWGWGLGAVWESTAMHELLKSGRVLAPTLHFPTCTFSVMKWQAPPLSLGCKKELQNRLREARAHVLFF